MRALMVLVVVMGVMIVGGVATLAVLLAKRMGAAPVAIGAPPEAIGAVTLDEPEGTRIVAALPGGEHIVVQLQGGGPDRVAVVDARSGRVVGRIGLAK